MANTSTPPVLYGIKNCDTVKKARKWLDANNIEYVFHDFRSDGLHANQLKKWFSQADITTVVNKRSTTWKQLDHADQQALEAGHGQAIIMANPTLIKRPVLELNGEVTFGFKPEHYQTIFDQ
ncbi:ArsC family reductase [Saccharophagus degradans]|uniref:Arsenate reductase and related n=1 Tax=Saccharophagus degradans (strain 2-40 / ATCC 43961 / DSM 17024) TaxID=203122 RepID=Q21HG4_SACD2|nr:ArsC family reductase [Saccharophagus degradans]ABD81865.1 conserved hypothetical protein [Saccharophagus degradans 2-40]MBU2987636.1 ArsC family reductase [Saccharophagus degradans]WGO99930.1 ArsC family reductase [Saccharophagus degradans]